MSERDDKYSSLARVLRAFRFFDAFALARWEHRGVGPWRRSVMRFYRPDRSPARRLSDGRSFDECAEALSGAFDWLAMFLDGGWTVAFAFPRCLDPRTGRIQDPALAEDVAALDSYTSTDPARTGVIVLVEGAVPPRAPGRRQNVHMCTIRVLDRGLVALTGKHYPGTPSTIESRQPAIDALLLGPETRGKADQDAQAVATHT